MTDAEKLFQWISGKRNLTVSEQLDFCSRGLCRMRTEASISEMTDKGLIEVSKPRRLFRPIGAPANNSEILTAILGGILAFNTELHAALGDNVTQRATLTILEITSRGRTVILQEFPVKEIRNVYGSEFLL